MKDKLNLITLSRIGCLVLLCHFSLYAQIAEKDSSTIPIIDPDAQVDRRSYRGRISVEYLEKFSKLSDDLQLREEELASLRYRHEAIKERSKEVKAEEQKALFKENLKTIKINERELEDEIKLLKKALRLLQENKSSTDPEKLKVINEVVLIEEKIHLLGQDAEEAKSQVVESAVKIDDRDVYNDPPEPKCEIVYNGVDAKTDKVRKEVAKSFLFGYTHPKLKSFFKEDHFLKCEVKLMDLDKEKYLWLYITIASKEARKTYGFIERNSPLKFELLNGEIVYATTAQNAIGRLEPYTGNVTYELALPLDKSKYRQFSKGEVDRIGIMWTSGYEQYEVYNVDVIMNQIECLESL